MKKRNVILLIGLLFCGNAFSQDIVSRLKNCYKGRIIWETELQIIYNTKCIIFGNQCSLGNTYRLLYGLQGINGALSSKNIWGAILRKNYFETQAYGHYWFNP